MTGTVNERFGAHALPERSLGFGTGAGVPRNPGLGRSPIATDVRALIQKMHRANPLWGAPHIHGELQKLGIEIAETTVAKYLGRRPASPSPTWAAAAEPRADGAG